MFTGLWNLGEYVIIILSKYLLTKVANAIKWIQSVYIYTYVDKLLIGTRKTANIYELPCISLNTSIAQFHSLIIMS